MKNKHSSLLLVGSGKHWAPLGATLEVPFVFGCSYCPLFSVSPQHAKDLK